MSIHPSVYFAGPVDYVEHRAEAEHLRDNWRHRFFGDLRINLLCPICLNRKSRTDKQIMDQNTNAVWVARFFVGYFSPDAPSFGTPVEVWDWCHTAFVMNREGAAVLVHPMTPGVYVKHLRDDYGLVVVRTMQDARSWLERKVGAGVASPG